MQKIITVKDGKVDLKDGKYRVEPFKEKRSLLHGAPCEIPLTRLFLPPTVPPNSTTYPLSTTARQPFDNPHASLD